MGRLVAFSRTPEPESTKYSLTNQLLDGLRTVSQQDRFYPSAGGRNPQAGAPLVQAGQVQSLQRYVILTGHIISDMPGYQ